MYQYPHHIGDFNTKTRHLSRLERAIYRDMRDMYFDTEQPLDGSDISRLARRLLCQSEEEIAAMQFVLSEFFELQEDGSYSNSDCDAVIAAYRAQAAERSEVKSNEVARQQRSRARRSAIFSALRTLGVTPKATTTMDNLLALCRQHGVTVTDDGAHVTQHGDTAQGGESVTGNVTQPPVTCHGHVTGNHNLNHNPNTPQPPSGGASGGLALATAMGVFFPEQRRTRLAEVAELIGELIAGGKVTGEDLLAAAERQQGLLAADDGKRCPSMLRWLREQRWMDVVCQPAAGAGPAGWDATRGGVEAMAAKLGLPDYDAWVDGRTATGAPRQFSVYEEAVRQALAARSSGVVA